jgi:hypothetical protein
MGLAREAFGRPMFAVITRTPPRPARPCSQGPSKPLFPPPSSPTLPPRCFRCLGLDHCVVDCRDSVCCCGCGRSGPRFPTCPPPPRLRRATSMPELPIRGATALGRCRGHPHPTHTGWLRRAPLPPATSPRSAPRQGSPRPSRPHRLHGRLPGRCRWLLSHSFP